MGEGGGGGGGGRGGGGGGPGGGEGGVKEGERAGATSFITLSPASALPHTRPLRRVPSRRKSRVSHSSYKH